MAKEPLQLWNLPIAFINVTNSETMVDCLKLLCPAVSPKKDERSRFHGIFDRDLSQSVDRPDLTWGAVLLKLYGVEFCARRNL